MYITPAKACVSVYMARSKLYTLTSCEEEKGNIG